MPRSPAADTTNGPRPRASPHEDGTVAFMGTPEEIMREEVLTDIFDTPVTVVPGPHGPIACYF